MIGLLVFVLLVVLIGGVFMRLLLRMLFGWPRYRRPWGWGYGPGPWGPRPWGPPPWAWGPRPWGYRRWRRWWW